MEFDIETWVPYKCDFKPITINTMFSDALGRIADMAMRMGSEFLYMERDGACPVGTLVQENLIRPRINGALGPGFAMVFSYSEGMEGVLYDLSRGSDVFGAGITLCGIWRSAILLDECKVLVVASASPLFDSEEFLAALGNELSLRKKPGGDNLPYFAEKFGYRRFSIPYETDDVRDLQIANLLLSFEFDETRLFVGSAPELSMDKF
jgi:hypothetical protein